MPVMGRMLLLNDIITNSCCFNVLSSRISLPFLSHHPHSHSHTLGPSLLTVGTSVSISAKQLSTSLAMDSSKADTPKEIPSGLDSSTEEEYASQSKLLQEFVNISTIDKAWTFKSGNGIGTQAIFSISQPNLLANKKRKFMLSTAISKENSNSVNFQWAPFPVEMTGASTIVPSPSGSKLLVVRNPENESPTHLEIWSQSQLEKEFQIPQTVHGSVYVDGWFEGISWNSDETLIAYVAEEPSPPKPTFSMGYQKAGSSDKDCGTWKGQGDWEEDWGETYAGKRQPSLFLINFDSGEVQAVKGIPKSLSVGQVVWAPSTEGLSQLLVFVGWPSDSRKLGIKYCYNRACALYASVINFTNQKADSSCKDFPVVNLTQTISSAFFPRFSPMERSLVFLSANVLWTLCALCNKFTSQNLIGAANGKPSTSDKIIDVISIVQCAKDDCFPGLYCSDILSNPWLSDRCTMILSSTWVLVNMIKIPVKDVSANLTEGAKKPFEAISSSLIKRDSGCDPLIAVLHGGHILSLSSFSKSWLFSLNCFDLLIINYRGSVGFGEEALQSLPGKVGSQDVNDVLTAIDHVIDMELASSSKITVLGGSHGGFLTSHLIGQAPDMFVAAAVRNPVCNLALMVGTTDIPEWCYVESYGSKGKDSFTDSPSAEHLTLFYSKSPISHVSKVKTPTLFLLGAQDLRVPFSNGLQCARALKEKGVETKVILFPKDVHAIERPQSDFESFLNIGVWFKKYCK
ncbi:acylamino-acid-releasing enzyme 1-like [Pistacia vera]|uniref:acylamino-acid-releasing enzyme 1-like n=1 Tax=Pistacia vera TaxID=55513 RepID=UPI00126330F1|nr:acylamino-acid-releasing enzyme 1-like [Pistacia vera]